FVAWMRREQDTAASRPTLHAVAVALYFVLGFMTKFVAALFLPLVLAVAALPFREWRVKAVRGARQWVVAALVAAALIAPWFAYAYARFGMELWSTMVGAHVYTRFTSFLDPTHVQPWYFYFVTMFQRLVDSQSNMLVIGGFMVLLVQTVWRRWPEGGLVLILFAV